MSVFPLAIFPVPFILLPFFRKPFFPSTGSNNCVDIMMVGTGVEVEVKAKAIVLPVSQWGVRWLKQTLV